MEDNPPRLAKQVPLVIELKPSAIISAPSLGLPDLSKLFTLYVTEEDKVAMGLLSQTMWMWDRPVASQNSWTVLPLGGQDAYGQLLWLPYWSSRQPS